MRILYLSQYFYPEVGATQTRAYEMASNWVRLGHHVTMIAELPNHPSGIIPPAYRGKFYQKDHLDGIEVIRVWVKASPIKNFRNRLMFYLSYMLTAVFAGLFLARGKYDLIYATSPPIFVGGAALILNLLRRIPLVFEVRDLWPEAAVALGELSNPRAIAWATRLEESCYRRARLIVVVTQGILDRLIQRGLKPGKLALIPNGANVELFCRSDEGRQRIRQMLDLDDSFIAIYAGIHGIAQGLETVIEAAKLLEGNARIHILLIGDGPKKAELSAMAQKLGLSNLTMLPEQSRAQIVDYLSAADIALIPLRNLELFKGALPSKMFDAWSCELPLLLSVDGEARRIMELADGGVFVPPEDPTTLAENLRQLSVQPAKCQEMGRRGREITVKQFSRQAQAVKLITLLSATLRKEQKGTAL